MSEQPMDAFVAHENGMPYWEAVALHNDQLRGDMRMLQGFLDDAYEQLAAIREHCRVVYYPPNAEYPIEHAPLAGKDSWDDLLTALSPQTPPHTEGE